jgi:hypothetical protein
MLVSGDTTMFESNGAKTMAKSQLEAPVKYIDQSLHGKG